MAAEGGYVTRDELLAKWQGKRIQVLDRGGVQLLDVMGSDCAIVQSARVSFGKELDEANRRDARRLIRYMVRHQHGTPFESCEIKLWVHLPIFVERQWARHRTAHWNELSARYTELPEEFYIPEPEQVCYQSDSNKQGRSGPLGERECIEVRETMRETFGAAFAGYRYMLGVGVAKETARLGLPVATYTTKVWKVDLRNLLGFLALRLDEHSQWEIRQYAEAIAGIVRDWVPLTWEAFEDFVLGARTFSRQEVLALQQALTLDDGKVRGWLFAHPPEQSGRENAAFLRLLGMDADPDAEFP